MSSGDTSDPLAVPWISGLTHVKTHSILSIVQTALACFRSHTSTVTRHTDSGAQYGTQQQFV